VCVCVYIYIYILYVFWVFILFIHFIVKGTGGITFRHMNIAWTRDDVAMKYSISKDAGLLMDVNCCSACV